MLLSRNGAYSYLNKFLVVEITTVVRNIPVEVPLGRREGLPQACAANCDNLHTVRSSSLVHRIGELSQGRHFEVKRAAGHALAWRELMDAVMVN